MSLVLCSSVCCFAYKNKAIKNKNKNKKQNNDSDQQLHYLN